MKTRINSFSIALEKVDVEQQIKNKEFILDKCNSILFGKKREDISDDMDTFIALNSLLRDESRKFTVYEKSILVDSAKKYFEQILKDTSLNKLSSYCDIGCGKGQYPRAAFELGATTSLGIDIKTDDFWKEYATGTNSCLTYINCNICDTPIPKDKYQLVTSIAAFEHFSDPISMLDAMSQYVKNDGYLFIRFAPIYNCGDGYHLYRYIHIPWFHLIFSKKVWQGYCDERKIKTDHNFFNKWSAINFMILFANFQKMKLLSLQPLWDFRYYWFAKLYPDILPPLSLEELMLSGFKVIYKK